MNLPFVGSKTWPDHRLANDTLASESAAGNSSNMLCVDLDQNGDEVRYCFAKTEGSPVITPPQVTKGIMSNGAVPVWTPDTYIKNQLDSYANTLAPASGMHATSNFHERKRSPNKLSRAGTRYTPTG